ncbi:MAG: efflux RND transporter periplasmic adaptor subunit [Candidatus Pacebacteria bacterium]|jgi:RND family efflux transporter MFP subunit|nr:efflux RND transporter periplasmic adaptor subunit [Candidatus Paceibacterota bacterium]MBT4652565.1 efflux RND transporter periplasmic adaptor subunit [Candidatus Paceibacterota bacterium]MBT6756392.1 efflux RND transporter periplasmic adaptor subunit [Candidatus Paceibacterota bacterium]MBT6921314.1 efflux RND transporter periplasmic adaptor subunit [Candidatus Paceibacterota bacterium]
MKKTLKNINTKLIKPVFSGVKNIWKTKKWLVIGILIVLMIAGNKFLQAQKDKPTLTFTNPTIETITKTLDVSGVIDAKEKASLRFAAGGKVVYLGAQEGDAIKKWQTIATIDQRTAIKTKEKSLNTYSKERLDWDQRQSDIEDGTTVDETTRRTINKEQYDLTNSVLDVELAAISISNSTMSSPFDGILIQSPTTVTGIQLLATDTFDVVNPNTLIFKALIDEADIPLISKNQTAVIEFDAYPDKEIKSFVSYISFKSVASSSGTAFIVELPIEATSLDIYRLGMNGDVKIELETKHDVLTIPYISIKERDGKSFVQIKTAENEAEDREVELGLETDERVEILSGLSETDEIVIPE